MFIVFEKNVNNLCILVTFITEKVKISYPVTAELY